jgi:hypothetical protein
MTHASAAEFVRADDEVNAPGANSSLCRLFCIHDTVKANNESESGV